MCRMMSRPARRRGRMNIIELALRLMARVTTFSERARRFFYAVVLSEHRCLKCNGPLAMSREGECRCRSCENTFDPTITFQRCHGCGGRPNLVVRRYRCSRCGKDVLSRFLFDGLVFDGCYFRQKMIEHRQRKKAQRERVRVMLAESRSQSLDHDPIDLTAVPGLADALNGLSGDAIAVGEWTRATSFDLTRYQSHIQAHLHDFELSFDEIPPLQEPPRLDRIWRFIAIIFMDHAGLLCVAQRGQELWMMPRETDREGQGVLGETEDADGLEGPFCGATTW